MSMTREEAIAYFEKILAGARQGLERHPEEGKRVYGMRKELSEIALAALRPIGRDQVEKVWRGEWIIEDAGKGDRRKKCSLCDTPISGWWGRDRFCANCGAPMTDEAVQMVMERLEALHGE